MDLVVQSTDKNFLVPVGGAVIASAQRDAVQSVSQLYPGRASVSAALDILITLLEMGTQTYRKLLADRKARRFACLTACVGLADCLFVCLRKTLSIFRNV